MRAEARFDQLIGGVKIAFEIMWQQDESNDETADDVSHDDLKKGQIGVVRQAGNADDGESAGFGCNDGKRDCPPRDVTSGEEVIAESSLALPKGKAEQR